MKKYFKIISNISENKSIKDKILIFKQKSKIVKEDMEDEKYNHLVKEIKNILQKVYDRVEKNVLKNDFMKMPCIVIDEYAFEYMDDEDVENFDDEFFKDELESLDMTIEERRRLIYIYPEEWKEGSGDDYRFSCYYMNGDKNKTIEEMFSIVLYSKTGRLNMRTIDENIEEYCNGIENAEDVLESLKYFFDEKGLKDIDKTFDNFQEAKKLIKSLNIPFKNNF